MNLVLLETLGWGWHVDETGRPIAGSVLTINGTVFADAEGTTPLTPVVSRTNGTFPGYMQPGTYLAVIDGVARQVEVTSGYAQFPLLNGPRAPLATDGFDGQFWRDTLNWRDYGPKVAGAWPPPVELKPKFGRIAGVILNSTPANLVDNANTYVQIAGAEFTATLDGDSPVRAHFEGAIGVNDGTVGKRGTVEIRMDGVTPGILAITLQNGAAAGTPGGYSNLSRKSSQIVPAAGDHVFTAWWKALAAPQTLRFFLGVPVLDFYVAHAPDE